MKINQYKTVQVDAKTLSLYMKVRDQFQAQLQDADGGIIKDFEGYVPDFMPGEHFDDYLILNIDIETGQITNWQKPTQEQIEAFVEAESLG